MSANTGIRSPQPASARSIAARVLQEVLFQGAFAAASLDAQLSRNLQLGSADRGLATELVYGVLRTRGALEAELLSLAPRGVAGGDEQVLVHLLVASYQLAFLERIPAFAAVDEGVSLVDRIRGQKVAGFCNAVLRRLATQPRPSLAEAISSSAPPWLVDEMTRAVGREECERLLGIPDDDGNRAQTAVTGVRLREGAPVPDWLASAERGRAFPEAYRLRHAGDLRRHPEYTSGRFVIQDEGSMVAAHALGALPGERILDACAGRGQKSSLLAERVTARGELWSVDKGGNKLRQLRSEFTRLGLPDPNTAVLDWTRGSDALPTDFDRVLVDAPCSGTGTLRRRPEITLRLQPPDVTRLSELAETILRHATQHAKPGGKVLFVVCSVLHQEGEALVDRVADVLEPDPFGPLPSGPSLSESANGAVDPSATQLRLLPGKHGTDGFFLASFRKR